MNKNFPLKLYIRILLILISTGLMILSFNDRFSFVAWFCLAPYFIILSFSNIRKSIFFSWLTGLLFFAGVTSWFLEYSFKYWIIIIAFLSLYFIFYGIIFYIIYTRIKWSFLRIIFISAIWVSVEYFRHRTFLAFPWGVIGYSQHNFLQLMQVTKFTGILGVSLLIVLVNLVLSEIIGFYISRKSVYKNNSINTKKIKSKRALSIYVPSIIISIFFLTSFIFGSIYIKTYDYDYEQRNRKINIALVQTNISFDDKYEKDTSVLIPGPYSKNYFFKDGTDLVVFPESIIWGPIDRKRNISLKKWLEKVAERENLYFIMGQILWDENKDYYNTVQLYDSSLAVIGRYNKIHPLPCGEYMPYPDILGFFSFLNIAKLNITPAAGINVIEYPGKGKIGTNICFESTIPLISRGFKQKGAGLLFTFTDDAGFKDSAVSWHHLVFSRVRAIENENFLIHIGNNGVSAIIDPLGKIMEKSSVMKKQVIYGTVYFTDNLTFYSRYGELMIFVYFFISFILLLVYLLNTKITEL